MKLWSILLGLCGVLAAIVLAVLLVLGTQPGLRWALKVLDPHLPVRLENVTGTLLSGIRATRAAYADEELEVTLVEFAVTPELACLFRGRVCLGAVSIQTLDVSIEASNESPSGDPLAAFNAVPAISVAELRVALLNLSTGDTSEQIHDLYIAGRLEPSGLFLESFGLCHDLGCADGQLSLDARGRWKLRSALDAGAALPDAGEIDIPGRLVLDVSGNLDEAELLLSDQDSDDVRLSGTVTRTEDSADATLELAGLASLLPALRQADWLALQGPLELQFSGDAESWNLNFAQRVAIDQGPQLPLHGLLRREAGGWFLEQLTLDDGGRPRLW
ncbi:MAG: hypothetical protein AAGL66_18820, partial [Pseudomonadota bacterium]